MISSDYSAVGTCRCGTTFEAIWKAGRKRKHCSAKCREAARAPKLYAPKGERPFTCKQCGSGFTASHARKYCSERCGSTSRSEAEKDRRHQTNKRKPPVTCKTCRAVFSQLPSVPGILTYCEPCAKARTDNIYSVTRRARIRSAATEAVNRIKVFERDKWACQMCGVKTVREPYTDRSAELDHIIPIAAGGEHSYRNTQCACRKCNLSKGASALGQLRLIG